MAENHHAGPAELGAPMDYAQHEKTYEGFLALAQISTVATIDVLIALVLFAYGGSWGFLLAVFYLILILIASAVGFMGKGSVRPLVVVFGIGVLLVILTVA